MCTCTYILRFLFTERNYYLTSKSLNILQVRDYHEEKIRRDIGCTATGKWTNFVVRKASRFLQIFPVSCRIAHSDTALYVYDRLLHECFTLYADNSCRICRGAKLLIVPVLAGLMECDPHKMWTFEKFFQSTHSILQKRVVHVFNLAAGSLLHIYINPEQRCVTSVYLQFRHAVLIMYIIL